ncbi:MAG: S-layer-related duplication domain protein [Methanothrix sp.]|nr:MAG: S-layer-related duplication domain protein [Methanothrix sp.]
MQLAFEADEKERGTLRALALLCLLVSVYILTAAMGATAQVPMAEVRGHFSDGDGVWNAEDFGWFYYDLDDGTGGERLTVRAEDRRVRTGDLVYSSEVWTEEFEFDGWGRYQAVAFLGKRYLAGYFKSDFTDAVSALEEGELREVLIDFEGIQTITTKTPLFLDDGYMLEVGEVSHDGEKVRLLLKNNGVQVDEAVVGTGETYAYDGDDGLLPAILVHVGVAMRGAAESIVDLDGLFQVRDRPTIELFDGEIIDDMKVATLSDDRIELVNRNDLILRRGSTVDLAGGLALRVRDASQLIYYPVGVIADYGVHEIRGPVYTEDSLVPLFYSDGSIGFAEARWNHENFAGFYFDDEDDLGTESLILYMSEGGIISPGREFIMNDNRLGYGFKYTSFVETRGFEFKDWGEYYVVGVFGQPWFAGYGPLTSPEVGKESMISENQVGQVLLDTDESLRVVGGVALALKDGYEVHIVDVSNDSIYMMLVRGGEVLDRGVVRSNSTYVYKKDVGDTRDLPLIALHVGSVFLSDEENLAIVDGIFQVSDRLVLTIDPGNDFAELKVMVINPSYIIMANPDWIHLKRDSRTSILPGINIAVAKNETFRYYLYKNEYVVPRPDLADVSLPTEPIPSGGLANFSIFVLAGEIKSVTAETVDAGGRRLILGDLTRSGVGARDRWLYSWQWNATVPALSDDGTILPESEVQGGLLQINDSTEPVPVTVTFDLTGRIGLIRGSAGDFYYISQAEYERLGETVSYAEMASNDLLRDRYIKIEPGESEIRFFQVVNGAVVVGEKGSKLRFSPSGLEPHLVRVAAPPGRYEIRLRIENVMDALQVSGLYFEVAEPRATSASVGSAADRAGRIEGITEVGIAEVEGVEVDGVRNGTVNVTLPEEDRSRSIPGPGAAVAAASALIAALAWRRRR